MPKTVKELLKQDAEFCSKIEAEIREAMKADKDAQRGTKVAASEEE